MAEQPSRIAVTNALTAVAVLIAAGVATWLLVRTLAAANAIAGDASRIARLSRGVNSDTDAVRRLGRTVALADAILGDARPLDGQLRDIAQLGASIDSTAAAVDRTGHAIDGTAHAIGGWASAIDSTTGVVDATARQIDAIAASVGGTASRIDMRAARIDDTARGVNGHATRIRDTSTLVDRDALLINSNLDHSTLLARLVMAGAAGVLARTVEAHQHAACIDREVAGRDGADGHCDSLRK